jgi:hypothetical protein
MERTEVCLFCERRDKARVLGLWFVNDARWPVHFECWIVAYLSGRLPVRGTQRSA